MRKLYSLLLLPSLLLLTAHTFGQSCFPNPGAVFLGIPGFYPSPLNDSLPDGESMTPYSATITAIIAGDTTIDPGAFGLPGPTVTVGVEAVRLVDVEGLPSGLAYVCNTANCEWPGDTAGCIKISGTPDTPGVYDIGLRFEVDVTLPIVGSTTLPPLVPITYFDVYIDYVTAVEDELNPNQFELVQNVPNPAESSTQIHFSYPHRAALSLSLINMVGEVVKTEAIQANAGLNVFELSLRNLPAGVYVYHLNDGVETLSGKMTIVR